MNNTRNHKASRREIRFTMFANNAKRLTAEELGKSKVEAETIGAEKFHNDAKSSYYGQPENKGLDLCVRKNWRKKHPVGA